MWITTRIATCDSGSIEEPNTFLILFSDLFFCAVVHARPPSNRVGLHGERMMPPFTNCYGAQHTGPITHICLLLTRAELGEQSPWLCPLQHCCATLGPTNPMLVLVHSGQDRVPVGPTVHSPLSLSQSCRGTVQPSCVMRKTRCWSPLASSSAKQVGTVTRGAPSVSFSFTEAKGTTQKPAFLTSRTMSKSCFAQ